MADILDNYINQGINPIGISYTDGTVALDSEPSAGVKKAASKVSDTFGYRDEAIGWELNPLNPDVLSKVGLTRNKQTLEAANNGTLDKQLAELQSAREKAWNSVKQAVVSESILGTLGSFGTLFDLVTGEAFKNDNNYTNPWSDYFNNLQEQYKANNPIYVDPDKAHSPGTVSWWASNFPSVMSSLTLLIPSTGITKTLGLATKATKLDKLARTTTKALTGARKAKTVEEIAALNPITRALNSSSTITSVNRALELGTNAVISRSLENWQEARQVWNDQYNQASESFNAMSNEEWGDYLNRHSYIRNELGENPTKDEVAKFIAKKSADETFVDDYANTIFDVAQLYALKNPLKLAQNMRTTTAVRRLDRLTKRYAGRLEQAEALEAKRKLGQKAKDYISDRLGNTTILAAELSEGVEEGINYVAQQEGMHLGNVLLDKEGYSSFSDRFWGSYYKSPELYESAFWGWLGGIVFQAGGSAIQKGFNTAIGKAKNSMNKEDETTKEKTNKAFWQDEYETAETKKRVESIAKRDSDFAEYARKMKLITAEDAKDPYHKDANNPEEYASFNSDIEKLAAAERAKQEFITAMTLREMDSGNLNLLKAYIQDKNVRQAFIDAGVVEAENVDEFITDALTKINNVEQKYNDNILALDNISSGLEGTVPFEYLQIIARDNVSAQMDIDDLTRRIDGYEVSAQTNQRRYNVDDADAIDFKTAASMVVAARRLAILRAQKRELENDKDSINTLEGQINLDNINKQIEQVNDYLLGKEADDVTNITRLLWATAMSYKGVLNNNGSLDLVTTNDYLDFLEKIARKDKVFSVDDKHSFELNDAQILSIFGEQGDAGSYAVLGQKIDDAFGRERGIDKLAPVLNDDYQTIANLEINKFIRQSEVATTLPNVQKRVNELHNLFNDARTKAINDANNIIFEAGKKYGYRALNNMIFGNEEVEGMSEADKTNIKSALDVLNLTSASNAQLAEDLHNALMLAHIESLSKRNAEESSTINQNPVESSESSETERTSTEPSESNSEPAEAEIRPLEESTETLAKKISLDLDNGISVKEVENNNNDDEFSFINTDDDTITLNATGKTNIAKKLLSSELFEGYDETNPNPYEVVSNPVIKEEDGVYRVVSKGVIAYNNGVEAPTQTSSSISSTGGLEGASGDTAVAEETSEPVTETQDVVASEEADSDVDRETEIIGEVHRTIKAIKDAAEDNKLTDEDFDNVANQLKEKYKSAKEHEYIDRGINLIKKVAERQGLMKKIADDVTEVIARSSSVVEVSKKIGFKEDSEDFISAVKALNQATKKLLDDYCKKCKLNEVDGKVTINLEDLLRFINETFEDKNLGRVMYKAMYDYLKENTDTYTTTDGDIGNDVDIINNAKKTREERIKEIVGSSSEKQRVDINSLFNNMSEMTEEEKDAFRAAIQSVRVGDELTFDTKETKNGIDILLKKGGVTIGRLPAPSIVETGPNAGNLYMMTKGWKSIVDRNGNSPLKDFFFKVLDDNEINSLLIEYAKYKNTYNKKENKSKIDAIYDKIVAKVAAEGVEDLLDKTADREDVVYYLASIWGYTNSAFNDTDARNGYIEITLNMWFDKLANSYYTLNDVQTSLESDKDSVTIKVAKVNSGVLDRVVNASDSDRNKQYKSFNYAADAIADKENVVIGCVQGTRESTIIKTSDERTLPNHTGVNRIGAVYAIIKNQSGIEDFAIGTTLRLDDNSKKLKGEGKKILSAVRKELNNLFNTYYKNPTIDNFNNLSNFLRFCFSRNNATPLFFGVDTFFNDNVIIIGKSNGVHITINNKDKSVRRYENRTDAGVAIEGDNRKSDVLAMLNRAQLNLPFDAFGPNLKAAKRSAANTDNYVFLVDGGGIYIKIKDYEKNFNDVKDYVVNGNVVKFNLQIDEDTKTNYKRLDDIGGGGNMVLEVNVQVNSSRPVEDMSNDTAASPVLNIINDSSIKDKGKEIAKLALNPDEAATEEEKEERKKALKALDDLHLLPKDIIFNEELNTEKDDDGNWLGDNAMISIRSKKVQVGNKWLDMFNERGEFAEYPKGEAKMQAIRKLVHEQLHGKLAGKNRDTYLKRIEEIYNEFKDYLDKNNVPVDDHIRSYLFANESKDIALEEFLVESLTSAELATYLNGIETDVEKKKLANNLWQKIMKLLSDIFEWGITEGSLYEKELYTLQKVIKAVEPAITTPTTTEQVATQETSNVQTQESTEVSIDDLDDFLNANDDTSRSSSVVEKNIHPSLNDFVSTLPTEQQPIFAAMLERGDVSISCR